MPILSDEKQQVVIKFTVEQDGYRFSDALYFTPEEYVTKTPEEIEAMQQARFNNWLSVIAAPRPTPTAEEIQAQVDSMVEQHTQMQEMLFNTATPEAMLEILNAQTVLIEEQKARVQAILNQVV
jgi:hypothetical protein